MFIFHELCSGGGQAGGSICSGSFQDSGYFVDGTSGREDIIDHYDAAATKSGGLGFQPESAAEIFEPLLTMEAGLTGGISASLYGIDILQIQCFCDPAGYQLTLVESPFTHPDSVQRYSSDAVEARKLRVRFQISGHPIGQVSGYAGFAVVFQFVNKQLHFL